MPTLNIEEILAELANKPSNEWNPFQRITGLRIRKIPIVLDGYDRIERWLSYTTLLGNLNVSLEHLIGVKTEIGTGTYTWQELYGIRILTEEERIQKEEIYRLMKSQKGGGIIDLNDKGHIRRTYEQVHAFFIKDAVLPVHSIRQMN